MGAAMAAFDQPKSPFGNIVSLDMKSPTGLVRPSLMSSAHSSHEVVLQGEGCGKDAIMQADEVIPIFKNAVEKHIAELQKVETHKRYHAAEALAMIGPNASKAVPSLLKSLRQDSSIYVRKSAALALGEIGDASARFELSCAASEDENVYVRDMAQQALQQLRCS